MKKQLIIVGIIILLVCVGLSGCNEQSNNTNNQNMVSLQELRAHLALYINKNVTVEGYVMKDQNTDVASLFDSASNPSCFVLLHYSPNLIKNSGMHRITGTVSEFMSDPMIDVISAEAI